MTTPLNRTKPAIVKTTTPSQAHTSETIHRFLSSLFLTAITVASNAPQSITIHPALSINQSTP
jgi:hypothetical protein